MCRKYAVNVQIHFKAPTSPQNAPTKYPYTFTGKQQKRRYGLCSPFKRRFKRYISFIHAISMYESKIKQQFTDEIT